MSAPQPDYYQLLGLPRDATPEEIRRAYRRAAHRYHPDKNKNPGETEIFLQIQAAYQVLSNPRERAAYDATLPPAKAPPRQLAIQTFYSRRSILPLAEEQVIYAMLEFSAINTEEARRPPLNICLVLDKSTSMKGRKLDLLKNAVITLLRQMRFGDVFSIVAFNDYAEVVLPANFHTDRVRAEARVHQLQAAGGTEIFQGLQAGLNEVRRFRDDSRVNHIILLTDGRTYGDEEKSLRLAKRAASEGIVISAMGLGEDWNDHFLDALARTTGGHSAYLDKAAKIEQYFLRELEKLQNVYARDLIFDFFTGEDVQIAYVYRVQPDPIALPTESPLNLGGVLYAQPLQVIFEFQIRNMAQRQGEHKTLLSGQLQADILPQQGRIFKTHVRCQLPVRDEELIPSVEPKMLNALSNMSLYRLQEKAEEEARQGKVQAAARRLNYLATHLLQRGQQGLAKTALLEAEHLLQHGQLSAQGGKSIKYGTRALLLPPTPEETP